MALFALLVQATIPYFTVTCPLYSVGAVAVKSSTESAHQMMADCPMMAVPHPAPAPEATDHGHPHKAHEYCSLCAALSPLNAFVFAGLIALPPPSPTADTQFFVTTSWTLPPTQIFAFSARGPPIGA